VLKSGHASLYGVVSTVFGNPDPFAYPILRFVGRLGRFPVTMVLSRRYIQFSSMTATFLADALTKGQLELSGLGTLRAGHDAHELHPLAATGDLSATTMH
jgi:hypothetical protein